MIRLPRRALALAAAFVAIVAVPTQAQLPVATEFDALHFRSIGPATMSGRVADVAVYEKNPALYYVGTAHGGVWKTTSNGALWTPLLQHEGLMSIGDVTMSQTNPDLVWVGTGESNNRQSTSWGDGVLKSSDGGKTFANMGLKDSRHINRIVISSANNDVSLLRRPARSLARAAIAEFTRRPTAEGAGASSSRATKIPAPAISCSRSPTPR